jgi:Arc/MetJ-type ribon-helix-helix transcriptional regulator
MKRPSDEIAVEAVRRVLDRTVVVSLPEDVARDFRSFFAHSSFHTRAEAIVEAVRFWLQAQCIPTRKYPRRRRRRIQS